MFVTGPLVADGPPGTGVSVRRVLARTVAEPAVQAPNPTMRGYVRDLAAPYGLAVHEDLVEQGAGYAYGELCAPLLDELVPEEQPADLLVLATGIPDIRFGRSTATYLSWHCAGAPLAFTVCDQGLLPVFTALRLIESYARSGACRRAVLLVAEQPTLYHELPAPARVPARAAAVGAVLEPAGSRSLSTRRHTQVPARHVPRVVADEIAALSGPRSSRTVLLGANLAEQVGNQPLDADVLRPDEGQPLTGMWRELARLLPDWQKAERNVLLAEYDPVPGHLFTATLHLGN
jgi:hypothetical protein